MNFWKISPLLQFIEKIFENFELLKIEMGVNCIVSRLKRKFGTRTIRQEGQLIIFVKKEKKNESFETLVNDCLHLRR
jgi:RNA-binding protein YhbY